MGRGFVQVKYEMFLVSGTRGMNTEFYWGNLIESGQLEDWLRRDVIKKC
jgi:hypothetical protein